LGEQKSQYNISQHAFDKVVWIDKVWTRKPLQTCLDLPKENRENLGLAGHLEDIIQRQRGDHRKYHRNLLQSMELC